MALCVPLMHRVHEIFVGLVISGNRAHRLGRDSGIQLNLIIGAVAAFFILGLDLGRGAAGLPQPIDGILGTSAGRTAERLRFNPR